MPCTLRQDGFHQTQAIVIVHRRPRGDLVPGAQAAGAQAIVVDMADADARTEHGTELEAHVGTMPSLCRNTMRRHDRRIGRIERIPAFAGMT